MCIGALVAVMLSVPVAQCHLELVPASAPDQKMHECFSNCITPHEGLFKKHWLSLLWIPSLSCVRT